MPELPEVETVKRGLDPLLRGRSIDDADIIDGRLTAPEDPVVVSAELIGERFTAVARRGKYLLFGLDSGRTLVVHLRMTGWFHHRTGAGEEPAHVRAVLVSTTAHRSSTPTSAGSVRGGSSRRRTRCVPAAAGRAGAALRRVDAAPVPRRPRRPARVGEGAAARTRRSWPASGTSTPTRRSGRHGSIRSVRAAELTAAEVRRLHAAVVESLERGIASQGATISNYRGPDGQPGSMQERFNAYDRDGEPCPRCGTPIEKIRVAQRGTHLCPRCTRLP